MSSKRRGKGFSGYEEFDRLAREEWGRAAEREARRAARERVKGDRDEQKEEEETKGPRQRRESKHCPYQDQEGTKLSDDGRHSESQ